MTVNNEQETEVIGRALGPNASTAAGVDADQLTPGTRVGEYVIGGEIGRGGFGTVYAAEHRVLGRQAAIKVLHSELCVSAEMIERFLREARTVNRIGHANIVDIYDFGTLDDKRPYQIMERLNGASVQQMVGRRGRFGNGDILALFEPLCQALQAVHDAAVVHRDLKPSNIMVGMEAAIDWVKLLDFGVAKLLISARDGWITSQGRVIGTPQFMAPEQIRGDSIDHRVDIYALGVLLFYVATGRLPFAIGSAELIEQQHLGATPPAPSCFAPIPVTLDDVVARALAKSPADRFPCVDSMWCALAQAMRSSRSRQTVRSEPARQGSAVAILIKVRLSGSGIIADEMFERMGDILDDSEHTLIGAGFQVALATRSTVIGICVNDALFEPGDDADVLVLTGRLRAHALETAETLAYQLRQSQMDDANTGESALQIALCVHAGHITVRDDFTAYSSATPMDAALSTRASAALDRHGDAFSSELLDPRTWPTLSYDGQVRATRAVTQGLADNCVLLVDDA